MYIPSNAGGHPPPRGGPRGIGKLQGREDAVTDVCVATNFGAVLGGTMIFGDLLCPAHRKGRVRVKIFRVVIL